MCNSHPLHLAAIVVIVACVPPARADEPEPSQESLHELVTDIVLQYIPHQYEDDDEWGGKKRVVRGVKWERDGIVLKPIKMHKDVNHGSWRYYRLRLHEPEQKFDIKIENVADAGDGRVAFDAVVTAKLLAHGRIAQWERGVQLIAMSADAEADVRLRITCKFGVRFNATQFPPTVSLDPEVTAADIQMLGFRVTRISRIGGSVAKELGRTLEGLIRRKLDQQEGKLVAKANKKIEDRREKLTLSAADFATTAWSELRDLAGGEKKER
jgi:hypothetical protein